MIGWVLVTVLSFSVGPPEPLVLQGTKPWPDLASCMKAGEVTANWLTQDFVTVKWDCVKVR